MTNEHAEQEALEHARDTLTTARDGVLHVGDNIVPIKFVTDPANGRLIASVPVATFFAPELIIFVPEETDEALQLLVSAEEEEESALTDRYLAYHGEPEHVRWAGLVIDSARHGPWVFDGDAMMHPNPVASGEAALCKKLNGDKASLAKLCERYGVTDVAEPLCVGVDESGLHVKARYGIVCVRFPRPAKDAVDAGALIDEMLKS